MDRLSFSAAVIDALAWPLAVVLAALALRQPFRELLGFLTKLKYGDLELSFGEKSLKRLEQRAVAAIPAESQVGESASAISPQLAKLAETSPRAAIIEAWIRVSNAALAALKARGASAPKGKHVAPGEVERVLRDAGILNDEQLMVLRQLRNMRNAAVHGMAFSADAGAALQFVATANRLAALLERQSKAG